MNNLSEIKSLVNNLLAGWGNAIPGDVRKGLRRIYELAELEAATQQVQVYDESEVEEVAVGEYQLKSAVNKKRFIMQSTGGRPLDHK